MYLHVSSCTVASCSVYVGLDVYVFQWTFWVSLLQQGISALAQHTLCSPSPSPFPPHAFSLWLSLLPLLSMCRQANVLCVCVCMRRVDGDAVCLNWELQGDWGNGEGYRTLTTATMQFPLPDCLLLFTSLHLSLFPLPLSLSPSRLRWTACPACSASFSAATTSPGKRLHCLTPSCPQGRGNDRDSDWTVPCSLPWLSAGPGQQAAGRTHRNMHRFKGLL